MAGEKIRYLDLEGTKHYAALLKADAIKTVNEVLTEINQRLAEIEGRTAATPEEIRAIFEEE